MYKRQGWSYKDKEIFDINESIELFNLGGIGKSPSKLDISRILSMNEYYIKNIDEEELYKNLFNYCEVYKSKINTNKEKVIKSSLSFLKNKAKTLEDIFNNSKYLIEDGVNISGEDQKMLDDNSKSTIRDFIEKIMNSETFDRENLEIIVNEIIKNKEINFKSIGQPLRVALTGSRFGPGLYDILISLGKEEVLKRLNQIR